MSYHFTQGRYRAFIETTYTDSSGIYQTVDGPAVEFDADPIEYFEFETNPSIKINLATLEPPEGATTLLREGDDHGIHYKLYENSLAILTGTQTTNFGEEGWPEWCEFSYIYAEVILQSGWVFKTSDSVELQMRNSSFKSGATSNNLFNHGGGGWQVLNIEGLDTSNLSDFSYMFSGCTANMLKGLNNLDFTSGNNFNHFASGLCCTPDTHSYHNSFTWSFDTATIDPTGTNHKFDYAFDFSMGVGYSGSGAININLTAFNNMTMFRHEEGAPHGYSSHYLIVTVSQALPNDCMNAFNGNDANWITLRGTTSPGCNMARMFANCSRLRYVQFGDNNVSYVTRYVQNMDYMFENCTSLYETPRYISMENCISAIGMYSGCENLGYSVSGYSSTSVSVGGPKLKHANKMFYNALKNWGSRAQAMDLSIQVDTTTDVDLSELLTGAGIGWRGVFSIYLYGPSSNHNTGYAVYLNEAFKGISARHVNVYVNRGSTGDQYLMDVSLQNLAEESVLESASFANLYIINAVRAFRQNTYLERLEFFDENTGGAPESPCKFANNAQVANMLFGCNALTQFLSPDNMNDQGSGVSIALPVSMRPYDYQTQTWGTATMTATQSLAGYSTYMGD